MVLYTSTPDYYDDYISHHGVKGMKWGKRKAPEINYAHYGSKIDPEVKKKLEELEAKKKAEEESKNKSSGSSSSTSSTNSSKKKSGSGKKSSSTSKKKTGSKSSGSGKKAASQNKEKAAKVPKEKTEKAPKEKAVKEPKEKPVKEEKPKVSNEEIKAKSKKLSYLIKQYTSRLEAMNAKDRSQLNKIRENSKTNGFIIRAKDIYNKKRRF